MEHFPTYKDKIKDSWVKIKNKTENVIGEDNYNNAKEIKDTVKESVKKGFKTSGDFIEKQYKKYKEKYQ